MSRLDSESDAHFKRLSSLFPPIAPNASVFERRARCWATCALLRSAMPSSVTVSDVLLNLAIGAANVRYFFGHLGTNEPVPTIIYFHGGGWVVGDVETHSFTCARLAREANALVASVEYPLAPEANWHTITETCFQAADAIASSRLAVANDTPIAIAGDSAGAHLAAVTALRVRDEGAFPVSLQALLYPCIDPHFDTASYAKFADYPGPTLSDMQWYWQQFAGTDAMLSDYRIAPSRALTHKGLPKSYIATAGCDPLRDDGREYARKLREAAVPILHDEFDSLPHGFLHMAKFSAACDTAITYYNKRIGSLLRNPARM